MPTSRAVKNIGLFDFCGVQFCKHSGQMPTQRKTGHVKDSPGWESPVRLERLVILLHGNKLPKGKPGGSDFNIGSKEVALSISTFHCWPGLGAAEGKGIR